MNPRRWRARPATATGSSIARDSNFTTVVQAAYTDEPCYAPRSPLVDEGTLYYWQVIPTLGGGSGLHERAARQTSTAASRARRTSSTRRCRRRPIQPVGGAAASGTVVFQWSPVPEQVKNYTIEISAGRLVQHGSSSRPRPTPRRTPRTTIFPVGTTALLARARQQRRQQGPRLVGHVDVRADAARADDHDGDAVHRARRSRRSRGRRSTAPPATRSRTCGPTASAPYHDRSERGGQLHQDDRHRSRQRAGSRGLRRQRQERLHADSRRRPHDRRAGRHQDAADQQARQARSDVRLEHEDQRQAVQGAGLADSRASSQPFLDEHDGPGVVHAGAHPAGLHRRRRHVLARRRGRPRRQRRRVQQGQEVHAAGAHAGVHREPAAARAARPDGHHCR